MARYRTRPVEVEAHRWDGTHDGAATIVRWVLNSGGRAHYATTDMSDGRIVIHTLEGDEWGDPGDYVIRDPFATDNRKCYPCKPDIFEATYEPVEES